MTNGYKVIDLKEVPIGASTEEVKATIPGIYDAIESTFKPLLLSGIVIDDTTEKEFPPAYIQPVISSGDFTFTVYGYALTVTDDDEVYYTVSEVESTKLKKGATK